MNVKQVHVLLLMVETEIMNAHSHFFKFVIADDNTDGGAEAWSKVCLSCNIQDIVICCNASSILRFFTPVVERSTSLVKLSIFCNLESLLFGTLI